MNANVKSELAQLLRLGELIEAVAEHYQIRFTNNNNSANKKIAKIRSLGIRPFINTNNNTELRRLLFNKNANANANPNPKKVRALPFSAQANMHRKPANSRLNSKVRALPFSKGLISNNRPSSRQVREFSPSKMVRNNNEIPFKPPVVPPLNFSAFLSIKSPPAPKVQNLIKKFSQPPWNP